jgi:protein gp37
MAERSAIEWTDHTFNPWIGCTKVGPGCDHCYAEQLATKRLGVPWGPGAPRRRTTAAWKQPRRWDRRAAATGVRERVFCASLADVFDNEVPTEWRSDLFALIRATPHLDWLLVTKRIGNAAHMIEAAGGMPANVWLGATIVNQAEADRDIPKLLATPATIRFLSMEPLLGPVDLRPLGQVYYAGGDFYGQPMRAPMIDEALDWIIVGGESGPGARPMHPDWLISLRDQCAAAGVPFLFKQWGEWAPVCAIDERVITDEQLYRPRLGRHQPEGPRRCKVRQLTMYADGTRFDKDEWSRDVGPERPWFSAENRAMSFMELGKKLSGRMIYGHDRVGVTHDGVPQVPR